MDTRICRYCKKLKPVDSFAPKHPETHPEPTTRCLECRERMDFHNDKWRRKNLEKVREYTRRYMRRIKPPTKHGQKFCVAKKDRHTPRNDQLLHRRLRAKMSGIEVARAADIHLARYYEYERMVLTPFHKPFLKSDKWNRDARQLAAFWKVSPAALFPDDWKEKQRKENLPGSAELGASEYAKEAACDISKLHARYWLQKTVREMLKRLSPKRRLAIELYFGFDGTGSRTYEEVTQHEGLSGRSRQSIESLVSDGLAMLRKSRLEEFYIN